MLYGKLSYPDLKENALRAEVTDNTVAFYGEPAKEEVFLFEVIFSDEAENPVGAIVAEDGTPTMVQIATNPALPAEDWNEASMGAFYAMMDSINVILEGLMKNQNMIIY